MLNYGLMHRPMLHNDAKNRYAKKPRNIQYSDPTDMLNNDPRYMLNMK